MKSKTGKAINPLSGSTDSNWIFDPSAFQNEAKKHSGDRHNVDLEMMQSGGSDSIHENFLKLQNKRENKMQISVPSNFIKQDIINRAQTSFSPKVSLDDDRFLYQAKKGHVSSMSGVVSREDHSNPLLFSINENLKKGYSARPSRNKRKVEEEIIDELFSNKRNPHKYSDISNLSAVRVKGEKKTKNRRRRSAFKGINPNQVFAELSRMRTNQQEKQEMQEKIVDKSCQITKKGKEDIEKMVKMHKTKTSMIYSEINSANTEDELADTVKALELKEGQVVDKRKLTFGFQMPRNLQQEGKVDLGEVQRRVLENSQLREEVARGLAVNFGENEEVNMSDFPKMQKKRKKKKTGSLRVIKTEKGKKKKKEKEKGIKKRKNSKRTLKSSKKKNESKKKIVKRKKKIPASTKTHLDKVISRYGVPLLAKKEQKGQSMTTVELGKSKMKKRESKGNLRKRKRNSILMNTTLETELTQDKKKKEKKKGRSNFRRVGLDFENEEREEKFEGKEENQTEKL